MNLTGYAYSADKNSKWFETIVIEAYREPDIRFITPHSAHETYYVSRTEDKVIKFQSDTGSPLWNLSLSSVLKIVGLIKKEECKRKIATELSWMCMQGEAPQMIAAKDMENIYSAPFFMDVFYDSVYLNISKILFSVNLKPLEASFAAETLNSFLTSSGLYSNPVFCACVNSLYGDWRVITRMQNIARLNFTALLDRNTDQKLETLVNRQKPLLRHGKLLHLKRICRNYANSFPMQFKRENLCSKVNDIQKECLQKLSVQLCKALDGKTNVQVLIKRAEAILRSGIRKLENAFSLLVWHGALQSPADIRYLTFDILCESTAFADCRRDLHIQAQKQRKRYAILSSLYAPDMVNKVKKSV